MAGIDTPLSLLDRLLRHDDADSWNQFSTLYEPLIRRWVGRLISQSSAVDDIVQEVLKALLEGLPGFQHNHWQGAFRAWLRTITTHRIRRHWRDRGPIVGQVSDLGDLEDPRSRLSRIWDQEHDDHVVRSLLDRIRPEFDKRDWEIFRCLVFEGSSARDIAQKFDCTANVVFIVKARVLKRLRLEARGLIE